jgi:predicted membrane protein
MASPALSALVITFFYTSPSALGVLFPEIFSHEVPIVSVCLAATVAIFFFILPSRTAVV